MAVITDANGWRIPTLEGSSKKIYVAANGSDFNNGLSPSSPKLTSAGTQVGDTLIPGAFGAASNGDWICWRYGDIFTDPIPIINFQGISATRPFVFCGYGDGTSGHSTIADGRPLLQFNASGGLGIFNQNRGTRSPGLNNIFIRDLHFKPATAHSSFGIYTYSAGSNFNVENCVFENCSTGVGLVCNNGENFFINGGSIRRNIFRSCKGGSHCFGLYTGAHRGPWLYEENVFWDCGFPDLQTHHVYIDDGRPIPGGPTNDIDVTYRFNWHIGGPDGVSHGAQVRPGGKVYGNVFMRVGIGLQFGSGGGAVSGDGFDPNYPVGGECYRNVFENMRNIDSNNPRGWCLEHMGLNKPGTEIHSNIGIDTEGTYPIAIYIEERGPGNRDFTIRDNVFRNVKGGLYVEGAQAKLARITLTNNAFRESTNIVPIIEHASPTANNTTYAARSGNTIYTNNGNQNLWVDGGGSAATLANFGSAVSGVNIRTGSTSYTDPTRNIRSFLTSKSVANSSTDDAYTKLVTRLLAQNFGAYDLNFHASAYHDHLAEGFDKTLFNTLPNNAAPVANAGPDIDVFDNDLNGSATVTFNGSLSTDDSGIVEWIFTNSSGVDLPTKTVIQQTTLPLGSHTFTHRVVDAGGLVSTNDTVVVNVFPGKPLIGNTTPLAGALSVSTTAVPNVTAYHFQKGASPGSLADAIAGASPAVILQGTPNAFLYWRVRLIAGSLAGQWSDIFEGVTLPDVPVIEDPVANAGPDRTINNDAGPGSMGVTFDGSLSYDPQGETLAYSWRTVPGDVELSTNVSFSLNVAAPATVTLKLVVTNESLFTSEDFVTVTVTASTLMNPVLRGYPSAISADQFIEPFATQ